MMPSRGRATRSSATPRRGRPDGPGPAPSAARGAPGHGRSMVPGWRRRGIGVASWHRRGVVASAWRRGIGVASWHRRGVVARRGGVAAEPPRSARRGGRTRPGRARRGGRSYSADAMCDRRVRCVTGGWRCPVIPPPAGERGREAEVAPGRWSDHLRNPFGSLRSPHGCAGVGPLQPGRDRRAVRGPPRGLSRRRWGKAAVWIGLSLFFVVPAVSFLIPFLVHLL